MVSRFPTARQGMARAGGSWQEVNMIPQLLVVLLLIWLLYLGFESRRSAVLQLIYLVRFPLIFAVLLFFFPIFSATMLPDVLGNVYIFDEWWEVAIVVGLAIVASWMVMYTAALLLRSLPKRFPEVKQLVSDLKAWWQKIGLARYTILVASLLAAPTIWITMRSFEYNDLAWWLPWMGLLVALVGVGFLLFLLIKWRDPVYQALRRLRSAIAARFGFMRWLAPVEGEIDEEPNFRHEGAVIFFLITSAVYIAGYWLLSPDQQLLALGDPPIAAYLLLLLITLGWLLSGLAFMLDHFRVPTSLVLLILLLSVATLTYTDHYYAIHKKAPAVAQETQALSAPQPAAVADDASQVIQQELPPLEESIANRADAVGSNSYDVMVVVMASGGGVRASLWTTQVLTGLQKAFGEKFANSIGLISGVSGGGVGAMYYVDAFTAADGAPKLTRLDDIVERSGQSTLGPLAWGAIYPDLWRLFFWLPGVLGPNLKDRGWAVETTWNERLLAAEANAIRLEQNSVEEKGVESSVPLTRTAPRMMSEWAALVASGKQPPMIFNSTEVQTGNRFIFTSFQVPEDWQTKSFSNTFPGYDVPVATAARMAATFPYVSPVAQAMLTSEELEDVSKMAIMPDGQRFRNSHLADGGYFDNDGVVSALEWVKYYIDDDNGSGNGNGNGSENKKRILFVHVTAGERFVPLSGSANITATLEPCITPECNGPAWLNELAGPILAVINSGGTGSQLARGPLDIQRFIEHYESIKVDGVPLYDFHYTVFDLKGSNVLSWQLSQDQHHAITNYWCDWETTQLVKEISDFLGDVPVQDSGCPAE